MVHIHIHQDLRLRLRTTTPLEFAADLSTWPTAADGEMGNTACRVPSTEEMEELRGQEQVKARIAEAAAAIAKADILVVHAGAGMSADSGLPTFTETIASGVPYTELCSPSAMKDDYDAFHTFWTQSALRYAKAMPHEGYDVLAEWATSLLAHSDREEGKGKPPPFFVVTSNVDDLFLRSGVVERDTFRAIHGSAFWWRCAGSCPDPPLSPLCVGDEDGEDVAIGACPECGGRMRPNVKLFGDQEWEEPSEVEERHVEWWSAVEEWVEGELEKEGGDPSVVVLEIGAGTHVSVIRNISEHLVGELCDLGPGVAKLIRINPDFPLLDSSSLSPSVCIPIAAPARDTLLSLHHTIHHNHPPHRP